MAGRHKHANANWTIHDNSDGTTCWDGVNAALLMDIRHELQRLNNLLQCPNFIEMPSILRQIRANTERPRIRTRKPTKRKKAKR